jgi:tetratricopeptide (TPR) repeat protein
MSGRPSLEAVLGAVSQALRADRVEQAMDIAAAALARGIEHALLLHLAAERRMGEGRHAEALPLLERARALAPADIRVLNALGQTLIVLGRPEQAIDVLDAAIAISPDWPAARFSRGQAREACGELEAALPDYEAAARQPNYPEPLAAMASIAARLGRRGEARAWAERALALAPHYWAPRMALAAADLGDRDFAGAEARIRPLLDATDLAHANQGGAWKMLGDALDGQGRVDEAYDAYAQGNALLRRGFLERSGDRAGFALAEARRLTGWFAAAPPEPWRRRAGEDREGARTVARHVFLVGFPRSGTTLLEQVLASHPEIVGIEERPTLVDPVDRALFDLDGLSRLPAAEADRLRAIYWERARAMAAGDITGKVLVDKLPLNTLKLPLIAKLFPDARILFAVRDPRDVVLSCFRQRFLVNTAMFEFLTLDGAARYYDAVMTLAGALRRTLPLAVREQRYEDLVTDFDQTVSDTLAFIGLDWSPQVRDFAAASRARLVNTPSAKQVARGLYAEGMGRWPPYAHRMGEALAILEPWVERFGYAPTAAVLDRAPVTQ